MADEPKAAPPGGGAAADRSPEVAPEAAAAGGVGPKPAPAVARTAAVKPAAPQLAGKTTTAAARVEPKPKAGGRAADDASPLVTRRVWIGLAWGAFTAASAAALAATGRFMFPNVLTEPPQQFTAGFPGEYGPGVDERWKERFGVWLVRTPNDIVHNAPGFYALLVTCTHLGCTPNWLTAEAKFKCPCHGSGFRPTGINFEGPAPRPLERARIVLADDGQILVDKSRKFQFELGQWTDPEAFLRV
jgi:cytochrome b6-f complex iron-sulfur subunit